MCEVGHCTQKILHVQKANARTNDRAHHFNYSNVYVLFLVELFTKRFGPIRRVRKKPKKSIVRVCNIRLFQTVNCAKNI